MSVKRLKTDAEWKQARQGVITATEAASLLGLNPHSTASKMWQEKTQSTFTGNACTQLGQLLEPIVVELANRKLKANFKIIEDDTGKLFYYLKNEKLGATPDACDGKRFVEAKTTNPFNFLKYRGTPPAHYIMQLQVQLICANRDVGYLVILGTDLTQDYRDPNMVLPLVIYEVKRCKKLEKLLFDELKKFWTKIKNNAKIIISSGVKQRANLLVHLTYKRLP